MTNLDIYSKQQIDNLLSNKQETLESGVNIKTINNQSLLGNGNISISGGGTTVDVITSSQGITNMTTNISIGDKLQLLRFGLEDAGADLKLSIDGYEVTYLEDTILTINSNTFSAKILIGDSLPLSTISRYNTSNNTIIIGLAFIEWNSGDNYSYILPLTRDTTSPYYKAYEGAWSGYRYNTVDGIRLIWKH